MRLKGLGDCESQSETLQNTHSTRFKCKFHFSLKKVSVSPRVRLRLVWETGEINELVVKTNLINVPVALDETPLDQGVDVAKNSRFGHPGLRANFATEVLGRPLCLIDAFVEA